jgi:type II secretory ATPase GspE/PulE/Tfp pilus assembly ATPase PilB-like protein
MVPEMLYHDYGISIDEIADNLLLATNQVLVKRVCPKCTIKKTFSHAPEWFSLLPYANKDEAVDRLMGKQVRVQRESDARAAEKSPLENRSSCSCAIRYENAMVSSGYIGRTVLAECIPFNPEMFEDKLLSVTSMNKKTAQAGNILDDAVEKIEKGMIDVDALWRLI